MFYLSLNKNQIKLLYLKKTLLGQYEATFYEKTHQIDLLDNGKILNTDLLASAVKEAMTAISPTPIKEKEIYLILPQETFQFLRAEVPKDMAVTALSSFIKDKARVQLSIDIDNSNYDYLIQENEAQQQILFFALDKEVTKKYTETFTLLNLQLTSVIPEVLAYFKLFEKTLRKDKKEFIVYASYEKNQLNGYLFDSYGPLEQHKWVISPVDNTTIEDMMKQKASEYEIQGKKLNRLILSGENSETIRQDTFTKNVGVWTNPLKRIIPNFYQEYIKLLVVPTNQTIPFLSFDSCIGAFIFSLENKNFSMFKKRIGPVTAPSVGGGIKGPQMNFNFKLPIKEIAIFLLSFGLSLGILLLVTRINFKGISLPSKNNVTATPTQAVASVPPTATPTPTPAVDRKALKVKVLNGSGEKGKATTVKDDLKTAGYEEILTGNADAFDYDTTEIQVKDGKTDLGQLMKGDLKDHAASATITKLSDKETTADIIVIVGKDYK
jgi:hypothetical protein